MTDTYLRSLGFAPVPPESGRPAFAQAWRYQHEHRAQDGAALFLEHPLGIDACRLSALLGPLAAQDVFATVALHDQAGLQAAVEAYYTAHGGVGARVQHYVAPTHLPYRRQR